MSGEGSGRDHPHSAAENRRIRQGNDAKDLDLALLGLPVARTLQTGRSQPRSRRRAATPSTRVTPPSLAPLAPRMGSLRGGGSASAALPVHARSTDTSPRTAPNSLLPTFPEDALDPDLAPPLFRKARSRTLSTPGDGSGLTTSLAIGIATQRSLPQSSHNTWSFRMIEAERTQDQDTTDPS